MDIVGAVICWAWRMAQRWQFEDRWFPKGKLTWFFVLFCFTLFSFGAGAQTQGFVHARETLCC
jgi:hypothetical protein